MPDAVLIDPTRPAAAARQLTLPHEQGTAGGTGAGRIHAIRKSLGGPRAFCDPRIVLSRLGGRFDYNDLDSCLRCIIETASPSITLT